MVKVPSAVDVSYLIEAMSDGDTEVRRLAAHSLTIEGIGQSQTSSVLVAGLKDPDLAVRYFSGVALGNRGLPPKDAAPKLIKALDNPNEKLRGNAITGLGGIGDESSAKALLPLLADESEEVRILTAFALGRIDFPQGRIAALPVLSGLLQNEEEWLGRTAIEVLRVDPQGTEGEFEFFLDVQINRLASRRAAERCSACRALAHFGSAAEPAVRPLIELLSDDERMVRHYAAIALRSIGTQEAQNVLKSYPLRSTAELFLLLEAETSKVQREAAAALGAVGDASEAVFSALRGALVNSDAGVRYYSMEALRELGAPAESLEEEYASSLSSKDEISRSNAVNALAVLRSERAVPALKMLLKDSIPLVRLLAAMALERIGTRDGLNEAVACLSRALGEPSAWYHGLALRSLVAIAVDDERKVSGVSDALEEYRAVQILGLKHRDIKTRREAARVLSNMGEGAEPAVEPLVAALEDRDIVVRGYSVAALRNSKNAAAESALARSAKRLVKDFIREIEGGDPAAARDAAFSLSQMGEAGVAAGPSLLPLMENRDKTLRRAAARALGGIVAPGSIPALTKALRDKDWGVRMNAARALGSFGSAAAEAAPQLVKLLTTKDVELRRAMAFHLR